MEEIIKEYKEVAEEYSANANNIEKSTKDKTDYAFKTLFNTAIFIAQQNNIIIKLLLLELGGKNE